MKDCNSMHMDRSDVSSALNPSDPFNVMVSCEKHTLFRFGISKFRYKS